MSDSLAAFDVNEANMESPVSALRESLARDLEATKAKLSALYSYILQLQERMRKRQAAYAQCVHQMKAFNKLLLRFRQSLDPSEERAVYGQSSDPNAQVDDADDDEAVLSLHAYHTLSIEQLTKGLPLSVLGMATHRPGFVHSFAMARSTIDRRNVLAQRAAACRPAQQRDADALKLALEQHSTLKTQIQECGKTLALAHRVQRAHSQASLADPDPSTPVSAGQIGFDTSDGEMSGTSSPAQYRHHLSADDDDDEDDHDDDEEDDEDDDDDDVASTTSGESGQSPRRNWRRFKPPAVDTSMNMIEQQESELVNAQPDTPSKFALDKAPMPASPYGWSKARSGRSIHASRQPKPRMSFGAEPISPSVPSATFSFEPGSPDPHSHRSQLLRERLAQAQEREGEGVGVGETRPRMATTINAMPLSSLAAFDTAITGGSPTTSPPNSTEIVDVEEHSVVNGNVLSITRTTTTTTVTLTSPLSSPHTTSRNIDRSRSVDTLDRDVAVHNPAELLEIQRQLAQQLERISVPREGEA